MIFELPVFGLNDSFGPWLTLIFSWYIFHIWSSKKYLWCLVSNPIGHLIVCFVRQVLKYAIRHGESIFFGTLITCLCSNPLLFNELCYWETNWEEERTQIKYTIKDIKILREKLKPGKNYEATRKFTVAYITFDMRSFSSSVFGICAFESLKWPPSETFTGLASTIKLSQQLLNAFCLW